MGRFLSIAVTALLCLSCATAPRAYIYNATPIEPEAWFYRLYEQAKACVIAGGITPRKGSEYDEIQWFMVPSEAMGTIVGLWSWPNRIFLDARYVTNPWIVRHEALHHLMGGGFDGNSHEQPVFAACVDAPFTTVP